MPVDGADTVSEGVPPAAGGSCAESQPGMQLTKEQGVAAVAAFLDESEMDASLAPHLCTALEEHGTPPGDWVSTLIAMPADTFFELIQAVKEQVLPSECEATANRMAEQTKNSGTEEAVAPEPLPRPSKQESAVEKTGNGDGITAEQQAVAETATESVTALVPSEQTMVGQIFQALDEDEDGWLNFIECASLASRTGGSMDRHSYETVVQMVGSEAEQGLSLAHLEDVYLKFHLGDVEEDWSQITGIPVIHGIPAGSKYPAPKSSQTRGETVAGRVALLNKLEQLRSEPFTWDNATHTDQLARVWQIAAPPAAAITAAERMLLPRRLELLVSLPLFMGFGSRMAQVRLANGLEEVEFDDGYNILTEGEPTDASSCMYCVIAGSPVAMNAEIGTLKVYQEGQWFGERGIVLNEPRAASVIANNNTRCLKLSRARIIEVMHNNLAGLQAHFEDVEAKYQARKAQLEGALEYDISSRALHIKFGRASAGGSEAKSSNSLDAGVDTPASAHTLENVSGRLASDCKLLPADGVNGLDAAPAATVAQGAAVNVLAAKGEWWEVEVKETGERGFVAARLVTVGAAEGEDSAGRVARRAAMLRRSVRMFDSLPDVDLTVLAMCVDSTVVGSCEPLLQRGEYPSSLLLLEAGSVEVRDSETGDVLRTLETGDCVCEEELVLVKPCTTPVVAVTDVVCLELRRADLVGLLSDRWAEIVEGATVVAAATSSANVDGAAISSEQREDLRVHDWPSIGFQSRSPDTDFRAMGSLALKCLDHFATRKPDLMRQIVLAYQADRATHYPPAITAVNVTEWLLEMAADNTLAASHFDPPTELATGMQVHARADVSETGIVTDVESSHGGKAGGHVQCKVRLDESGRVRTYFGADVVIVELPTYGYTVFTFGELFCELFERFDLWWKEKQPASVMEFATISDEFRSREAVRWARDKKNRKILGGSSATTAVGSAMGGVASVGGAAVGGVAAVGGAAVGGVAAVGGMGAAAGKAAIGRLGSGMKGLRRKASSARQDEGGATSERN